MERGPTLVIVPIDSGMLGLSLGLSGVALLERLKTVGSLLPAIMVTGDGDVPVKIRIMASDATESLVDHGKLLASVGQTLEQIPDTGKCAALQNAAATRLHGLTARQHQVMDLVLAGHPNKIIAALLNVSQRTVENHRAAIMKKTGSKSLPALVQLVLTAA